MNSRTNWFWYVTALLLLGLIIAHHSVHKPTLTGPTKLLPHMRAGKVTSVQVRPKGQLEIRAERVAKGWELVAPVRYPAQGISIDQLLLILEKLAPAAVI